MAARAVAARTVAGGVDGEAEAEATGLGGGAGAEIELLLLAISGRVHPVSANAANTAAVAAAPMDATC